MLHGIMEWIYTQTKVSGRSSLELAVANRKKERRKERLTIGYFYIGGSGVLKYFHGFVGAY